MALVEVGPLTIPSATTGSNAVACSVNKPCLYAFVCANSPVDGQVNLDELRAAVAASASATMTHAQAVSSGMAVMPANWEGQRVDCSNTNLLRFASKGPWNGRLLAVVAL